MGRTVRDQEKGYKKSEKESVSGGNTLQGPEHDSQSSLQSMANSSPGVIAQRKLQADVTRGVVQMARTKGSGAGMGKKGVKKRRKGERKKGGLSTGKFADSEYQDLLNSAGGKKGDKPIEEYGSRKRKRNFPRRSRRKRRKVTSHFYDDNAHSVEEPYSDSGSEFVAEGISEEELGAKLAQGLKLIRKQAQEEGIWQDEDESELDALRTTIESGIEEIAGYLRPGCDIFDILHALRNTQVEQDGLKFAERALKIGSLPRSSGLQSLRFEGDKLEGRPDFYHNIKKMPARRGQARRHIVAWHTLRQAVNQAYSNDPEQAMQMFNSLLTEVGEPEVMEFFDEKFASSLAKHPEKKGDMDQGTAKTLMGALFHMNSNPQNIWLGDGPENSQINSSSGSVRKGLEQNTLGNQGNRKRLTEKAHSLGKTIYDAPDQMLEGDAPKDEIPENWSRKERVLNTVNYSLETDLISGNREQNIDNFSRMGGNISEVAGYMFRLANQQAGDGDLAPDRMTNMFRHMISHRVVPNAGRNRTGTEPPVPNSRSVPDLMNSSDTPEESQFTDLFPEFNFGGEKREKAEPIRLPNFEEFQRGLEELRASEPLPPFGSPSYIPNQSAFGSEIRSETPSFGNNSGFGSPHAPMMSFAPVNTTKSGFGGFRGGTEPTNTFGSGTGFSGFSFSGNSLGNNSSGFGGFAPRFNNSSMMSVDPSFSLGDRSGISDDFPSFGPQTTGTNSGQGTYTPFHFGNAQPGGDSIPKFGSSNSAFSPFKKDE